MWTGWRFLNIFWHEVILKVIPNGNFPLTCWLCNLKTLPKQCRLLQLPLVSSQNQDIKNLFLKTPHTSDTSIGGIQLELTWKPPTWGLALIVSNSVIQALKGEKKSTVLPRWKVYKPQKIKSMAIYPHRTIVAFVSWGQPTANLLDLNPTCQEGIIPGTINL